jgi:hypothetical protein
MSDDDASLAGFDLGSCSIWPSVASYRWEAEDREARRQEAWRREIARRGPQPEGTVWHEILRRYITTAEAETFARIRLGGSASESPDIASARDVMRHGDREALGLTD